MPSGQRVRSRLLVGIVPFHSKSLPINIVTFFNPAKSAGFCHRGSKYTERNELYTFFRVLRLTDEGKQCFDNNCQAVQD